jgi:hypothetical protein
MKTKYFVIAISFPFFFAACSTDSNLTPISRWALAVNARVHPPAFYEPDHSYEKVAAHCKAIVKHDMAIAWRFANRPDQIEDSTVIQLTGEYVKSDSPPQVFEHHMAMLDTAQNVQLNYTVDYSRQFASDPSYWVHKPITEHIADQYAPELTALRTALALHRQVVAMNEMAVR